MKKDPTQFKPKVRVSSAGDGCRSGPAPADNPAEGTHAACPKHGQRTGASVSYIDGANVAGFVQVADAMLAQGVV